MDNRAPLTHLRFAVPLNGTTFGGQLTLPKAARGVVIFAHDTPGSRHCSCNLVVAAALHAAGLGTLLFDLLSPDETADKPLRARLSADIPFLAGRLVSVTRRVLADPLCRGLRLGYCGACAGGAASLIAAAWLGPTVGAVVARAASPQLADGALERVEAPSLLIAAENDADRLKDNENAIARMRCVRELAVVNDTADLFLDPAALAEVARRSSAWFQRHLASADS